MGENILYDIKVVHWPIEVSNMNFRGGRCGSSPKWPLAQTRNRATTTAGRGQLSIFLTRQRENGLWPCDEHFPSVAWSAFFWDHRWSDNVVEYLGGF